MRIMNASYGIIILVGLGGAIILYRSWRKQQAWRGIVTRIVEKPAAGIDGLDVKDYVDVHYQKEDGQKGKIRMEKRKFENLYFGLREGDILVKESGEHFPRVGE